MPRDQETSFGRNLFRKRDDQSDDESLQDDHDPIRDPFGADENTPPGDTPIGDNLSAGRHAGLDGEPSDTPGEWVAGSKGPGHDPDQDDTAVADAPAPDALETTSTAPVDETTGTATDLRATRDPEVAPDTQVNGDAPVTSATEPVRDTAVTEATVPTSGTDAAPTTDAASTTEVAPGAEVTPDTGIPAQTATTTSATTDTPVTTDTDVDAAAAAGTAEPPTAGATAATPATVTAAPTGAPVPGAPGTGSTTGVGAASAALVTNGAELHDDWARIQSSFVDDPQGSVSQAADLVSQVTGSLVSAVQERERTLRSEWDGRSDSDTENLRNALRDYRAFFELLIKL